LPHAEVGPLRGVLVAPVVPEDPAMRALERGRALLESPDVLFRVLDAAEHPKASLGYLTVRFSHSLLHIAPRAGPPRAPRAPPAAAARPHARNRRPRRRTTFRPDTWHTRPLRKGGRVREAPSRARSGCSPRRARAPPGPTAGHGGREGRRCRGPR